MNKTKIKDILSYDFLSSIKASDDGSRIALTKTRANYKENKYDSDIFIYDEDLKRDFRLTDKARSPLYVFDSGSKLIYRYKSDDNFDYFYLTDGHGIGSETFKLGMDVSSIKRLKDETYLIIGSKKKSQEEKEKENSYFKEVDRLPFWLNGQGFIKESISSYYLYDRKDDELKEILVSDEDNEVGAFAIADDLSKIAYSKGHYTDSGVMELRESIIIKDLKSKEEKVLASKAYSIYYLGFLEDELIFVGTDMKKGGINEDAFIYHIKEDSTIEKITGADFDKSFGNSIGTDARFGGAKTFAVKEDRLFFVVTEKEESKLYSTGLKGDLREEISGCVEDFALTDDDIYYLAMGKESLSELKKKSSEKTLIENKIEADICPIEEFTFESSGDSIRGYVLLPQDFDKDKKYPTILSVHGGPKTEFADIFHHEHQVLGSDGYIIIYTNPHGSSGNGVKYSDIRGRYGEIDYEDLMKFTDLCIEKYPQIDKDRLGIYGGSYGGFMTNWTIGHTDRFKAAVSQRSISNWTSFYGVSDIGYYFASDQTDSNPWDSLDKMWDQSPLKYAKNAKTPTLFIHADEDYRCPLEQGIQMYSRLKLNGVDTKMYIFHKENHELSRSGRPKARIKRLTEIKNWFDRYLKDEDIEK